MFLRKSFYRILIKFLYPFSFYILYFTSVYDVHLEIYNSIINNMFTY